MSDRQLKTRHYKVLPELISHVSKDMSEEAMKKKALSMSFLQHFLPERPRAPRLVSSAHGKINRLLLTIPGYAIGGEDNPLWKIYKDLFFKLPQHTRFLVLTHQKSRENLLRWLQNNGLDNRTEIATLPDYLMFTVWGEDGYAAVTDTETGKPYLMEPHSFPRFSDELIADMLSRQTDITNLPTPLYFEGGNILIGDDFFFIGADYPIKSLRYMHEILPASSEESRADLISRMYHEYLDTTRELIYVGSTLPVPTRQSDRFEKDGEKWREFYFKKNKEGTVQPIFHIDMFITLAGRSTDGKYQVLVGDPRMAAAILEEKLTEYSMAEMFDNVAYNLERVGFKVIRNPLPLTYIDEPEDKERHWFFATANNALVEIISDTEKTVWLPTYGYGHWYELHRTDEANRRIFEELGFTVILLEDCIPLAEDSGSVHCIKKYLERG